MVIQQELELNFPAERVTEPVICRMACRHEVVFNFDWVNISHRQGHIHLSLFGEEEAVKAAESYLREQGVEVTVLRSGPHTEPLPARPARESGDPGEPVISRKLWITFLHEHFRRPLAWEMACRFDVTFDVRQSSTSRTVSIMAILLEGRASQVEAAIEFLRDAGAEVEPIEKSVVEG